ncbi:MAG: ATP-binding protein [Parcubacteria group bacterium]|nr:ATP-binding protein [Parcubacteria group bacterium]
MTATTEVKLPNLPEWFSDAVASRFRAEISSVFILHGDITCLVPNPNGADEPRYPYIPLQEMFARVFSEREMVIFYNIATGMRFLKPEMEKEFRKVAEIAGEEDADPKDVVAAAKAGLAMKRQLPREPELCLPLIEKALRKMERVAVIIEQAHFIAPESTGGALLANERTHIARLRAWAQDSKVKKKTNIVLLLTDLLSKVSGELRQASSRITAVLIPKPTATERKFYIERQTLGTPEEQEVERQIAALRKKLSRAKGDLKDSITQEIEDLKESLNAFPPHFEAPKDFNVDSFVNATQGMSLRQILEIFRAAKQSGRQVDISFVKEKKKEILNAEYGDVMEIAEPQWDLDSIGGLAKQKAYFASVLEAIRKGEARLIPQGITVMGPPGTGKTALIEALAKGASYNFVKMKNARSMWVGMSEERTERQIQGLWALAPVIVMNDEADLGEANRDSPKGDSGVSERIMQAWMRFLSDPRIRGRVVMVNCTNRPDRMDAAMKRSGRSDDRIAILMPTPEERSAIFGVMFRRYDIATSITDFSLYATMAKGLSGADIEAIALKSLRFAGEMDKKKVDDEALREAIDDFIPSASQSEIDLMTLLAISESSSRRLLPENAREIIEEIKERNLVPDGESLIAQIEARNIIKPDEVAAVA